MKTVPDMLEELSVIYKERNAIYRNNYFTFGPVIDALLEVGTNKREIFLSTSEEINKLAIIFHIVDKLTRYMANWPHGHDDSLKDIAVYTQILRELHQEDAK